MRASAGAEQAAPQDPQRKAHRRALMLKRRCGWCAEPVSVMTLLKGKNCPRCLRPLIWPAGVKAETIFEGVEQKWQSRRWLIYGLSAGATFLAGFVPILPVLVQIGFMIWLRYSILRAPVKWFSPARRFTSRFTLKLWLMIVGLATLAINALIYPLLGASIITMLVCVGGIVAFVEGALWFLRGRLRRETEYGNGLQWWEWSLPASLLTGAVLVCVTVAVVMIQVWHWLQAAYESVIQFFV